MKGALYPFLNKISLYFLACFALLGMMSACSITLSPPLTTPSPSFSPIPSYTATRKPTNTRTSTQTPSPTPTLSPTAFSPFNATVWANNVNLRTNPGTLFDIRASIPEGMQVLVLGRSLGDEWMYVRLPTSVEGWTFAQLLDSAVPLTDAPLLDPGPVQMVTGLVLDKGGKPVSGIHFAIIKGPGDNPPRTDAITGSDGMFYAFLPPGADGAWDLYYTSIACTSNVMDENCEYLGGVSGQPYPSDLKINLPVPEPLYFTWK
jgi:hypothetical protein